MIHTHSQCIELLRLIFCIFVETAGETVETVGETVGENGETVGNRSSMGKIIQYVNFL